MTRSGPGAGGSPVAITAPGSRRSARRPGAPGRGNKVVAGLVALGLARHLLRSRRFQEGVAVTAVALEALRSIGKDNRAGMMARASAWNKRQVERLEHEAERLEHKTERQVKRLEHKAERQVKRLEHKTERRARAGQSTGDHNG